VLAIAAHSTLSAHDGPPFPIVSNQTAGPYVLSVWTDPDSTDDGTAGGRFWITIGAPGGGAIPVGTVANVTIAPVDRSNALLTARAEPVGGAVTNQLASLVMDHEGRFSVRAVVSGPLGHGEVTSEVDATYDLRPSRILLVVYALPFVLVAFLWIKLMMKRRTGGKAGRDTL
jgi:hypothetical protein